MIILYFAKLMGLLTCACIKTALDSACQESVKDVLNSLQLI